MAISADQAQGVYERADCLFDKKEVYRALDTMAEEITKDLKKSNPLVLCLMTGGLVPTSELLIRLDFPLELDYIHASRYGGDTRGTDLTWRAKPKQSLAGRDVLVIDDILDEGETLKAIVEFCQGEKVNRLFTAVLVDKNHDRKTGMKKADYVGLEVPDRYVFGFGMDYKGYLRNVPGIYAAQVQDE